MADNEMQLADPRQAPPSGMVGRFMTEMSMAQRLAYLGALALLVGGFVVLMLWVNKPDFQVLYSGLTSRDASSVVTKLKEMKVPYKLDAGGQLIRVPAESVYDTRLALAGEGLPRGQGIGFEVFNEVKMGTTEFVQKINYQRALQGELARTISSFSAVEAARVHIVMPRDSLFVEEEKKPTAGVVLRLSAGRKLSQSQVQGIVHLVAAAVPDLNADQISVVDTRGNLLYRKATDTGDFPSSLTAGQLEYQRNIEGRLRSKVQSMLEEVLGSDKASVRVTADIDFTRTSQVQQVFDPDRVAVRSETRSSDTSRNSGPSPSGSPDQRFALAARNASPNAGESGSSSDQENETTNFEITSTRTQTLRPVGGLKKLSVAVVIDGTYKTAPAAEGEEAKRTYVPRSADEMRQITALVHRAVGYDEKRGDLVTVENMPRVIAFDDSAMVGLPWWQEYIKTYGRTALNIVLGLLFFLMVVRPLLKYITSRAPARVEPTLAGAPRPVGPGGELPPGTEEEALLEEAVAEPRKPGTREQIQSLAAQDPERITSVLRAWIHESETA